MIIDTIENLEKYATLNPLFPKVVEFLKSHDLNAMADGKYEIVGNDLLSPSLLPRVRLQMRLFLKHIIR